MKPRTKAAYRDYKREWDLRNREKAKAYYKTYYAKYVKKIRIRQHETYLLRKLKKTKKRLPKVQIVDNPIYFVRTVDPVLECDACECQRRHTFTEVVLHSANSIWQRGSVLYKCNECGCITKWGMEGNSR